MDTFLGENAKQVQIKKMIPQAAGGVARCPPVNTTKDGRRTRGKRRTNLEKIDGPPGSKAAATFLAAPRRRGAISPKKLDYLKFGGFYDFAQTGETARTCSLEFRSKLRTMFSLNFLELYP